MRILIDYDGTVSVKGRIASWKIDLMREAIDKGHTIIIYTSRRGEAVQNLKNKIHRKFGLKVKAIGGRENFDIFVDEKAGGWGKLISVLDGLVRRDKGGKKKSKV